MTAHDQSAPAERYGLSQRQLADLAPLLTGRHRPGPLDAIVDIPGVRVGHCTVTDGRELRTGVTAVIPDQLENRRLPANLAVGNGFGKFVGATQIVELGEIETPILLTSTLSAFRAADALVGWMLQRPGHRSTTSLNPVVGECNDGQLSDIRRRAVLPEHVVAALDGADARRPAEGAVGAGTGMITMGFKGGIGTASRLTDAAGSVATVGVLALTNFSGRLLVDGVPDPVAEAGTPAPEGNSCILVVATDAPVDARQLGRIARRAVYAMGRAGAEFAHGSGDYAIAVGVAGPELRPIPDAGLTPLFTATTEATTAAIVHSLLAAHTTVGASGRVVPGLLDVWQP